VRNVVQWLSLPLVFIHDLLQGEWARAENTAARFVVNGLTAGLGDPATDLGHPPVHYEDAGQTIAVWGVEDGGPYLVLPLLGPSNARDAVGRLVDFFIDPVGAFSATEVSAGRIGGDAVDFRARNMEEIDDLQQTSLDYYAAVRSLYRQRRDVEIKNGAVDELQPAPGIGVDFDVLDDEEPKQGPVLP
jgi:phospholipid-binding lipoprotein MlaA